MMDKFSTRGDSDIGTFTCCELSDGVGVGTGIAAAGSHTGFFWMARVNRDLSIQVLQPHMYQGRAVCCVVNTHTVVGCLADGRYCVHALPDAHNPSEKPPPPPLMQDIGGDITCAAMGKNLWAAGLLDGRVFCFKGYRLQWWAPLAFTAPVQVTTLDCFTHSLTHSNN